jgi:hypothetical protein
MASPRVYVDAPGPSAPKPSRGTGFWIMLTALIVVSLCLCLVLSIGGYYMYSQPRGTLVLPIEPTSQTATPEITLTPHVTLTNTLVTDTPTMTPTLDLSLTPTTPPQMPIEGTPFTPTSVATESGSLIPTALKDPKNPKDFSDNFTNPNSGWPVDKTSDYLLDYFPENTYIIDIFSPGKMMYAIPPYYFTRPVKNITLKVQAKLGLPGNGAFGVMCNLQDSQNYYRIALNDTNNYQIGKMIKGTWTALTSPAWTPLAATKPDSEGYYSLTVMCIDSFIVLDVNGIAQAKVIDADLKTGDVALFAVGGEKKDTNGNYASSVFRFFSVTQP